MFYKCCVSKREYIKYIKNLKSYIIVDSTYDCKPGDFIYIVPYYNDTTCDNVNSNLNYNIISVDFDETVKDYGVEGLKKGYLILNLAKINTKEINIENKNNMFLHTKNETRLEA
jgi:hypothetical protein